VTRLQSLIDGGIYGLVGPQPGSDSLAVAPILQQANVPACVLSSTISVTQQGNPYVFRCQASDIVSVQGAILFAKKKLHATSVALMHTDDAYGTQAASAFVDAASRGLTKINLTANLPLTYNGTDFTAQWSRALASHPGAVIVWATGAPAAIILRNAKQLGVNVPIIGGSGMTGASIAPAGSDANGLYATNLFDPAHPTKLQQKAIAAMRRMEGKSYEPSLFELLAWDDVHIFASAIKNNPKNGLLGMQSIKHLTLTEGTYSFGPANRNALGVSSLVITQVKNGTAVGVATGKSLLTK
jgi:branched-chain amino acid transport system substrate-binding protein